MKIKLDENIPADLAEPLTELGHDAHTVQQEGLKGRLDDEIRAAAAREGRLLITQDVRFADIRLWKSNPGGGVLLLRTTSDARAHLFQVALDAFRREPVESWSGNHVVVSEDRVRLNILKEKRGSE